MPLETRYRVKTVFFLSENRIYLRTSYLKRGPRNQELQRRDHSAGPCDRHFPSDTPLTAWTRCADNCSQVIVSIACLPPHHPVLPVRQSLNKPLPGTRYVPRYGLYENAQRRLLFRPGLLLKLTLFAVLDGIQLCEGSSHDLLIH